MNKPKRALTLTRIFGAPRETVWKAWTDPIELAKWWGPNGVTNPECKVDARVGGNIRIVMLAGPELGPLAGRRWPMDGEVVELTEPERLVFSNNAVTEDGRLLIEGTTTVTLADEDGTTRLTLHVEATGIAPEAPRMLDGMVAGWTQSVEKLGVLVTR